MEFEHRCQQYTEAVVFVNLWERAYPDAAFKVGG